MSDLEGVKYLCQLDEKVVVGKWSKEQQLNKRGLFVTDVFSVGIESYLILSGKYPSERPLHFLHIEINEGRVNFGMIEDETLRRAVREWCLFT